MGLRAGFKVGVLDWFAKARAQCRKIETTTRNSDGIRILKFGVEAPVLPEAGVVPRTRIGIMVRMQEERQNPAKLEQGGQTHNPKFRS